MEAAQRTRLVQSGPSHLTRALAHQGGFPFQVDHFDWGSLPADVHCAPESDRLLRRREMSPSAQADIDRALIRFDYGVR